MCAVLYGALADGHVAFGDALGFVAIASMFCFAAMLVFGLPLLYLYKRLDWSGFFAFAAGGTLCAAATELVVWSPVLPKLDYEFVLGTLYGTVEGVVLRLMLFGIALHPASSTDESGAITPSS